MEEFDYAWGEVEKGIRDSFRQGRENKRNRNTAESWNLAQREIDSRPSQVSSPPKRTVQRRIKPAQTPNAVSAPPAPEITGERPEGNIPSNFGAGTESDLTARNEHGYINPDGTQNWPGQSTEEAPLPLGDVPTPASPLPPIEERDLRTRKHPNENIRNTKYNESIDALQEASAQGRVTDEEADDFMGRHEEYLNQQYPDDPMNLPKPTLDEAKAKLPPIDPIDAEIKETTEAIDLSDGEDNTPDLNVLDQFSGATGADTNTDHWDADPEAAARNEEALRHGMDAMRPEPPAPEPAPMQPSVAPEPPEPPVIETPASEVPQIEEAVTSEPAPVPKAEPAPVPKAEPKPEPKKTKTQKKTTIKPDKKVDEKAKEAHAKEVRSKMAPNAKRPEDPKAEPAPEPPNPTDKLPKASPKAKETAADINSTTDTNTPKIAYGDFSEHQQKAYGGDKESIKWIEENRSDIEASGYTIRENPKNSKIHKPDKTVSAVAPKKANAPAGKADKDVEKVMGKKQPNNPKPKAKPKPKKSKKN